MGIYDQYPYYNNLMNAAASYPGAWTPFGGQQTTSPYTGNVPVPNAVPSPTGQTIQINSEEEKKVDKAFTIDYLHHDSTTTPETVGLSMDKLIYPSEKPRETSEPVKTPEFDSLVYEKESRNLQKYILQPVTEERSMLPKPVQFDPNSHPINYIPIAPTASSTRKVNNWFTRLLEQRGQDYISSGKLTIDEVSKNVERILDDMISGRIDYSKQGQYIIQPIILDTLINYCANKLAINRASQFALGYVYNDYTNRMNFVEDQERIKALSVIDDSLSRNITQAIAIVNQDIGMYEMLYNKLKYVEATKNASSLFSLPNDLGNLKKQMKRRY